MPNIYSVPYVWKPDRSFQNILRNGDFEQQTKGTDQPPDGWTLEGTGATVQRVTIRKGGKYAVRVDNVDETEAFLQYELPSDLVNWYRGRTVTLGCWAKIATPNAFQVCIQDSGGYSWSLYHSGTGKWEFVTVLRTIDAAATFIRFLLHTYSSIGTGTYLDGAVAVEGEFLPAFIPHVKDRSVGLGYESPEAFANNVIQKTDVQELLNLSEQGDVAWTDLDINTAGSGYVPGKAHAVILDVGFSDSGFPGADASCTFRKNGEVSTPQSFFLRPNGAGGFQYHTMVVGLDANGVLEYMISASGTNTAGLIVKLAGWIEPA